MKFQWIFSIAMILLVGCQHVQNPKNIIDSKQKQLTVVPISIQPRITNKTMINLSTVQQFIDQQVNLGYFDRQELETFFSHVNYKPNIIQLMDKPTTSRPWYQFRTAHVGGRRIENGDLFLQEHADVLNQVAHHYGVPVELIVAILGIETNYGHNMGNFRVADALATLGFYYPRRALYFQKELGELLRISKEENKSPLSFKGSYAGAMGMPQFMSSSYQKWAVDWDGDGQRDIWFNVGDASASVANYMKQYGWQTGRAMAIPVQLSPTDDLLQIMLSNTELKYTAAQFRRMGVQIPSTVKDDEKVILFQLETSPGVYEYWVGLHNYYVVWHYNNSRQYVSAVREIANGLHGGGAGL